MKEREIYKNSVNSNRAKNNLKKWGVEYPAKTKQVKDKSKSTQFEKYDGWYRNTEEYIKKSRKTKTKKYGDPNYSNREKYKKTMQEKYGRDNIFSGKEGAKMASEGLFKKYGVTHPSKMKDYKEKVENTKIIRYGSKEAYTEEHKRRSREAQIKKYGRFYTQLHIKNFENYSPEYWVKNYSQIEGEELIIDIKKILEYHNITNGAVIMEKIQETYGKEYKIKIKLYNKRGNKSIIQELIFEGIKVEDKIYNARNVIGKEIDIYLPNLRIGVEYNGLYFHSAGISGWEAINTPNYDINYHLHKTLECERKGIKLLHIFEGENIGAWLNLINDFTGGLPEIKVDIIKKISAKQAFNFIKDNGIQDYSKSSLNIAAYSNEGDILGVLGVKNLKGKIWITNWVVKIGFSSSYILKKIFKWYVLNYKEKEIYIKVNRRQGIPLFLEEYVGIPLKITPPEGFFFNSKIAPTHLSKFKYEGKEAEKKEWLINNGYRIIFDCGNIIYKLQNF